MEEKHASTVGYERQPSMPPLMVVSFAVGSDRAAEFNDFYNGQFLPQLMQLAPEIKAVHRYQKFDVDAVSGLGEALFYTFYELDCEETLAKTDSLFGHGQFKETLGRFRQYKDTVLSDFARVNYLPVRKIPAVQDLPPAGDTGRQIAKGGLPSQMSGRYLVSIDLSRAGTNKFLPWYLERYQPEILSAMPAIVACSTYMVARPADEIAPTGLLTLFDTADSEDLAKSLGDLGQAHFGKENPTWQSYCRDYSVTGINCLALRSIFSLP